MTKWISYLVPSKKSRLTQGHRTPDEIKEAVINNNGNTAYTCYFDLSKDDLKNEFWNGVYDSDGKKQLTYLPQGQKPEFDHYVPELTFSKYDDAPARFALDLVSFDFDNDNDPAAVLDQVRKFVGWLDLPDIAIFYSGKKGFHVMIPVGYFPFENGSKNLPNQIKDFATVLKATFSFIDLSIYNYNRKFRVPFTRHESTGLFKTLLTAHQLNTLDTKQIQELAKTQNCIDFLTAIDTDKPREVCDLFLPIYEESKRVSYEIETHRAGTVEKPSKFEAYGEKVCINKMLEARCDDVGRNNACMRIVNDLYRTGKTREVAERTLERWAVGSGLPKNEWQLILINIYDRGANYNFGCQDEIKANFCSAKCAIWKKLDPEKRPQVVDAPESAAKIRESKIVDTCLTSTFKCTYNEERGEYFGGNIVKADSKSLFIYKGGFWQEMDETGPDKIKRRLNLIANGKLTSKNLDQAYKLFLIYVPNLPEGVNIFNPNPTVTNFKNGTLHLVESKSGDYSLDFRAHDKEDYCTSIIDIDFDAESDVENTAFREMLDRIFDGDESKDEKILAISEMFGASLMPFFPHLFFLHGKAHSGKSTILIILSEMLGKHKNMSSVEPKDFYGFMLEGMVGKLVNMVTDVDTRKPMQDNIVKQIEDRVLFSINRKNRSIIQAPLPSVHIFGGNKLMPSYEGYSEAMKRRWTIIDFNNAVAKSGVGRNFAQKVFHSCPQGVLNFALGGLKRLIDTQGYFTEIKTSEQALERWANLSDPVSQFLSDCFNGESMLRLVERNDNSLRIKRGELYAAFKIWHDDAGYNKNNIMPRNVFYQTMDAKNYSWRKIGGERYFLRLGESIGDKATRHGDDAAPNNQI